ncbi:DMT family transporter [Planosporangium flavigriseum]|uniref:Multidrug transporter n=1 Tax=Planosporangium flavigriseum TaxID=373681 RepID=A0A8J3PMZ8_9ACTN|nr:DMT family transporter [Planosporangium flavigriseum]NJC66868.1 DMT family transporter [Planosporangium flavigriseum]GIG74388.1 multidrug transporter [Planosporangium flavigriseum]
MLSLLFALTTAIVWGTADFCGGKASQRAAALAVAVLSRLAGLPVLALGLIFLGGAPTTAALGWGAVAGLFGMSGVTLLYRALAAGSMTVVAPVTAVTSALVPFLIGIALDGAPGTAAMVGAACAIGAIALVSAGPGDGHKPIGPAVVGLALAAGASFGLFMTLLSRAGDGVGLWPLAASQLTGLGVGWLLLWRTRTAARLTGTALRWAVPAGALDFAANIAYLLAARDGVLSVVAPIASLYPATTILLALAIDRERIRPLQLAGLVLAATALVLVVV